MRARANGDAVVVGDDVLVEVTDEDAALLEGAVELATADAVGLGKNEVGLGVQHHEIKFAEGVGGVGAGLHDLAAVLHVVVVLVQNGTAYCGSHAVDVIRIGGIADGVQVGDQRCLTDAKAQASTRQRAGLGKRARDEEVVVLVHKGNSTLRAEVHVGLVDDHHLVRVGGDDLFHLLQGQGQARGGVGVGY